MKSSTPSGGKIIFVFVTILVVLGGILYLFWPKQLSMTFNEMILPSQEKTELTKKTEEGDQGSVQEELPDQGIALKASQYSDSETFKKELEQYLLESEKFLVQCESSMDQELEDFVALAPEEVLANESLAREKFKKFLQIQTHNRPLSKIYQLVQPNVHLLSDDYILDKSAQLRPCRPFIVLEMWSRMVDGLIQGKWPEDFQNDIKSALFPYLVEALTLENRVFSLGLYVTLLEKMAKGKLISAESELELKRIQEQVAEFGEVMRNQLGNVDKDEDIKGAALLLSQDITEARKIKEDLLQIVKDTASQN